VLSGGAAIVLGMSRAEPAARIEGPNERGLLVAYWPGFEGVRGVGRSAEEARAAAFDALVEELRRGMTAEERDRVIAYKHLSPEERTQRAVALLGLTWSER
jgi:hypothetical protein